MNVTSCSASLDHETGELVFNLISLFSMLRVVSSTGAGHCLETMLRSTKPRAQRRYSDRTPPLVRKLLSSIEHRPSYTTVLFVHQQTFNLSDPSTIIAQSSNQVFQLPPQSTSRAIDTMSSSQHPITWAQGANKYSLDAERHIQWNVNPYNAVPMAKWAQPLNGDQFRVMMLTLWNGVQRSK
jgi:hypothetical protein